MTFIISRFANVQKKWEKKRKKSSEGKRNHKRKLSVYEVIIVSQKNSFWLSCSAEAEGVELGLTKIEWEKNFFCESGKMVKEDKKWGKKFCFWCTYRQHVGIQRQWQQSRFTVRCFLFKNTNWRLLLCTSYWIWWRRFSPLLNVGFNRTRLWQRT